MVVGATVVLVVVVTGATYTVVLVVVVVVVGATVVVVVLVVVVVVDAIVLVVVEVVSGTVVVVVETTVVVLGACSAITRGELLKRSRLTVLAAVKPRAPTVDCDISCEEICSCVQEGFCSRICATTPATWGAACDVPERLLIVVEEP